MNGLMALFVIALAAETIVRLVLTTRQISAVRAHRGHIPAVFRGQVAAEDHEKAADYTVARAHLGCYATLYHAMLKMWFVAGGGLAAVNGLIFRIDLREPWHGCLVILAVFALLQVLELPFALWGTFRVEARFGFNRTTPGLYTADLIKQWALGLLLGTPLIVATLMLMQGAGAWWWAWAWLLWLIVVVMLAWAAPRFIAPLFNRFTAITDAELKKRVETLLQRCGFTASGGVFVMDGSRRSAHGNAYFTGVGRNKRIVFFDTLLAHIELDEVEAVLAHELGHFRLHHVRQRLLMSMATMFAALALLGWSARAPAFYAAFGVPATPAMALLLFAFVLPPLMFFATPIEAWWSRRQEYAADAFATRYSDPNKLISALIKLYRDNATTLTPDRAHSAFYDSHPSALARITHLRKLAPR